MWDLDASNIATIIAIINVILVFALVYITFLYSRQVKKQTEFMKIDRDVREMDNLVAPLFSKIGDNDIFFKDIIKRKNGSGRIGEGVKEYYDFWDNIRLNKYLGSAKLRLAIDNYLKIKIDISGEISDESYMTVETELFKAIEKRYSELENDYSDFRKKH